MEWIVCLVCVHQSRNHAEPIFPLPQVVVFLFSRQFTYQMMFMSFKSSTTGITSEMEQELLTIPIFCLVRVVPSLVFCVVICRLLFVFWLLCCLCLLLTQMESGGLNFKYMEQKTLCFQNICLNSDFCSIFVLFYYVNQPVPIFILPRRLSQGLQVQLLNTKPDLMLSAYLIKNLINNDVV